MNTKKIVDLLLFFVIFSSSCSKKAAQEQTMKQLFVALQGHTAKGRVHIKFSGGEWRWHEASEAIHSKPINHDSGLKFEYPNRDIKKNLIAWLEENGALAVIILIPENLPSQSFFEIESILSQNQVSYQLAVVGAGKVINIAESNFRSINAINSEGFERPVIVPSFDIGTF